MGLVITTFVPDGIVVCSDSLCLIRNNDDGFWQSEHEKIFVFSKKFVLAIESNGYYQGIPISVYINNIAHQSFEHMDVNAFADYIANEFVRLFNNEPVLAYVAGYQYDDGMPKPKVYLLHNGSHICINEDGNGNHVYNYHAVGRTHWINKLMQNTQANVGGDVIELQTYDIDFSKYSLLYAKEFALKLISISETMDNFSQLKPMLGGRSQYAIIRPFVEVETRFV